MAGGTHPLLHNINVYVAQDCTGKLHVCIQNENWEMVAAQMSSLVLQKMYEFSSVVLEKLGERCANALSQLPTSLRVYTQRESFRP